MKKMEGSCTIIVNKALLASLLLNYSDQIIIDTASKWSNENDWYFCEIRSNKLPKGFHGQQDIIVDYYEISFKLDVDV
jgi:hypothetical protein